MNFMPLSTSFEMRMDHDVSVREQARRYARERLRGRESVFDTLSSEDAANLIRSRDPVTFGVYDPNGCEAEE